MRNHLQFALFIQIQHSFLEVVHLAEHQGLVKHSVVTPQKGQCCLLQDLLLLSHKRQKER